MKASGTALTRRRFLIATGAGGVATAAAMAAKTGQEPAPGRAATVPGGKGYHVTEHVRKYYDTTKV
jgi:hypothetical protein